MILLNNKEIIDLKKNKLNLKIFFNFNFVFHKFVFMLNNLFFVYYSLII